MLERRRRIRRFLTETQIEVAVTADQPRRDIGKVALDLPHEVIGRVDTERSRNKTAVEHFCRGRGDVVSLIGAKPYPGYEPIRRAVGSPEAPQPRRDRQKRRRFAVQRNEPVFPHGTSVTPLGPAAIRSSVNLLQF